MENLSFVLWMLFAPFLHNVGENITFKIQGKKEWSDGVMFWSGICEFLFYLFIGFSIYKG